MFGMRITPYLGTEGNNFILNGKQADLNAEEVYNCLTAPCWGSDVVYDAPHAKFMEQKRVCIGIYLSVRIYKERKVRKNEGRKGRIGGLSFTNVI